MVIRDVVDDADAVAWKKSLDEFVSVNPDVEGGFFLFFLDTYLISIFAKVPRLTISSFSGSSTFTFL